MDITKLPETLTFNQVKALRNAFGHFYDQEQGSKFTDPQTGFRFQNVTEFVDYLYSPEIGIPKGTSAKVIGITLESWYETTSKAPEFSEQATTMTAATEYGAESNTLTPDQLKQFQVEERSRTASFKKSQADAKTAVEAAIKKQRELAETTKNAKVYVKVRSPAPVTLTEDQTKSIEILKNAAKAKPEQLRDDLAKALEEKLGPSLPKDVSPEEANKIYRGTSSQIVANLQGNSLVEGSVAESGLSQDKKALPKIITDTDTVNSFKYSAQSVADIKILDYVQARRVALAAFGEPFANNVFGPENLDDIKVYFSTTPKEGFHPYDLSRIPDQYSEILNNQGSFIGSLQNFSEGEIKSRLLSQAGTWINTQIARLPADSLVAQAYNNELVQGALSSFGFGSPIAWEGTTFFGRIAIQNGLGPVLGWAQNLTGINFGVSKAVSAVASEVVGNAVATTAATEVGAEIVAGTVGATAGTGAGVAIGQIVIPIPFVGAAIGAALTWIGTKIAKLIPWQKIKENLIAISGGLLAAGLLIFPNTLFGTILSVTGGVGLIGGVINGGLAGLGSSLSGIGTGIAGFFGAIGGAFLGAVGMPILVTLLVFPVVVALVLFIINSSAYIVPPQPVSGALGPLVGCTTEKSPISFPNTVSNLIAKRAWEITADLYQGFGCLWNRSPKAPPQYFPNDTLLYPPGYPELFDYEAYRRNPNPESESGLNLFWCTWLIQKSYSYTNNHIASTLWVPTMLDDFTSRGKFVPSSQASNRTVLPGSVVFFNISRPDLSGSHVGIVYSVNVDGFSYVQSNAFVKEGFIPFGQSGEGAQSPKDLGEWRVVGVGLP